MKRRTVGLVMCVVTLGLAAESAVTSQRNDRHVNPDIYVAFSLIEAQCWSQETDSPALSLSPSVACEEVIELSLEAAHHARYQTGEGPTAEYYYHRLDSLGFELPSFYQEGYDATPPLWKQLLSSGE